MEKVKEASAAKVVVWMRRVTHLRVLPSPALPQISKTTMETAARQRLPVTCQDRRFIHREKLRVLVEQLRAEREPQDRLRTLEIR